MLKASQIKSVLQEDDVLGGGATYVNLFDGDVPLGSAETYATGVWTFTAGTLAEGTHNFTSVAMESSGNDSLVAQASVTGNAARLLTVADGATVEIDGVSGQSVTFAGATGTLVLDDAPAFTGQISGLNGSDALDLADVSYGANTTGTFLGNTNGGTLTITDGTHTANIALVGNYLSSNWDLSSDGSGGTIVVDPVSSNNWQTLDVGAGGWLTGIDVAPDGTMVVRTDTYGAYIWNGTEWQQLITSTSMPAAFVTSNSNGQGVYEIQIAPSNSNIIYMAYDGYVFQSTNKGTTWTETSFAPVTENTGDAYRMDGQKMAVDPENPNVVYVGTPQNGLFVTTNGGTTWQSVTAVPASLNDGSGDYPGIDGIEFDPALGVTGGMTNTIFAASYGNGVYESTNAGATWSAIGGPSFVSYAAVSSTGVYYAVGDGDSLWSYQNGTWTELLLDTSGIALETVAVDPLNPNEIVTQDEAGNLNISYNAGATWSGLNDNIQLVSTDISWLATTGTWMSIGGTVFNPLVPNELISSAGVGVWTTNIRTSGFTSSTSVTWSSQSIGIEQLVANEIIVPPGGDPVLASWDRAFFYISNANVYPATYSPNTGDTLTDGWSIDYASSDPSFLVGIADNWGLEESGYSTNGGQTWTPFPSFIPGAGTDFIGGTIAASSPTNIIWAPAGGVDPYYTLNGGETWNPITLPGVSTWSGFDYGAFLDARTVTADRVLPNTFYLYYADYGVGYGVYETTNGGVSWTEVYNGPIGAYSFWNAELQSVPGEAGNLFFTAGPLAGTQPVDVGFYQSTDGGAAWTAVPNVLGVNCFGFGAPVPGQSYPSIYIVGWVNNVYGIWQSINDAQSWTQIGTYPLGDLDTIKTISGSQSGVYVGFAGSGYAYLPVDPVVTGIAASPSSGIEVPGNTVTLTLTLSEAVTVAGGTPTLTLNDGGTATYTGGSGTDALTFSYTVSAGQSTASLSATAVNLNSATVTDGAGNAANLSLTGLTQTGPQIDSPPTVSSVTASGSGVTNGSGDLDAGHVITLTVNLSGAVTVAGTPTLTLNDGGTAIYTGGSGTDALTFSYTVLAGQNTSDLAVTAVNLIAARVTDAAGNAAVLTGAVTDVAGKLQIDTTTPTVSSVTETPSSGDLNAGNTVTLTLTLSEAVTVAGGTPTLTLNDGGTATYTGGSGTDALTFSYTVSAGQSTASLSATAVNLNSATVTDGAGNAANLSLTGLTQTGPQIGSLPTVSSVTASGSGITNGSGDLDAGHVVTLTVNLSEAVTVAGVLTLTLNDGGTAIYTGGSGTDALTFSYTVLAGQNTSDLAVTAVNLITARVTDAAGNAAVLTGAVTDLAGKLQIDTTTPTVSSVTETASSGDLNAGKTVTLTLTLSEAVTVAGGTLTLTLNDGGTATYTGGSGTDALTFSYTVAAGQNTSDLTVTAVNLNSATVTDGAGNAANLSLAGLTQTGPQIDTTTPKVLSVAASGIGISNGSGDLYTGMTATLTLTLSEAVTVAGGTLTLTLNDGGTATYTGGSGTDALTFSYTVGAGQNTSDLTVTAVNLNSATVKDGAGNAANLSLTGLAQTGLQIDTTSPAPPVITPVELDFNGSNTLANFKFASDDSSAYLANSKQTGGTLSSADGAQRANIALLGNYMASSFAMASYNHGGSVGLADASELGRQWMLGNPSAGMHHA